MSVRRRRETGRLEPIQPELMMEAMNLKRNMMLTLQYDGSRYDGWQRQGNTEKTIQEKLEQVVSKLAGCPVEVHGSGRTDRGVHALGQTAHFFIEGKQTPEEIRAYLNSYLPEDILVTEVKEADLRFHSRLSAVRKTYRYQIETGPKKPVFERKYFYGLGQPLDDGAMRRAASFLVGTHDFKSFCANKRMKKTTVRTIDSIRIEREDSRLYLTFTGNGFLQQMVRIMTGTLIEVGLGKREAEQLPVVLAACDRQAAGYTAPAEGLFLVSVEYEKEGES